MEINTTVQKMTPLKPKVLVNEQIEIYVPVGNYHYPGLASFDTNGFIVSPEGHVKLRRNPVRNVSTFEIDKETGEGTIYYDDGTISKINFPVTTNNLYKRNNLTTIIQITPTSFIKDTVTGKCFAAFSNAITGFDDADYLVSLETSGFEYYRTETDTSSENHVGFYTVQDTVFKGNDGSILICIDDEDIVNNFSGRLLLLGGSIFTENNVAAITYVSGEGLKLYKTDNTVEVLPIATVNDYNILKSDIETVEEIAKGAQQALSFATYADMQEAFIGEGIFTTAKHIVGQSVYIGTVDVPDLWISAVYPNGYTNIYDTDEAIVNALNADGYIISGHYQLRRLETGKVPLSDYVNKAGDEMTGPLTIGEKWPDGINFMEYLKLRKDGIEIGHTGEEEYAGVTRKKIYTKDVAITGEGIALSVHDDRVYGEVRVLYFPAPRIHQAEESDPYTYYYDETFAMLSDLEPIEDKLDTVEEIAKEIEVINLTLEQSGLVKKYKQPITQEYNERVTADGANVLDGSKAVLKRLVGNTVACKNLWNASYTMTDDGGNVFFEDSEGHITINPDTMYSFTFSCKYKAVEFRLLLEFADGTTASVPMMFNNTKESFSVKNNLLYMGTGTSSPYKTYESSIAKIGFRVYGLQRNGWTNDANEMQLMVESGLAKTDYQPYFTGLKSASFGGIESTNADGTETSTLAFPKTETPLGTTIDFENKKITKEYEYLEQSTPFTEEQLANYTDYIISQDGKSIMYKLETPIVTDFTTQQSASGNEYTAYKSGTEKVLENDGNDYGADNTLTQDYILVTEV